MSLIAAFSDPSEIDNPFQWNLKENLESVPEDMIGRLSIKIEEKSLEEEIEYESIILHLALSYEELVAGEAEKSRDTLRCMVEETTKLKKGKDAVENSSRLIALEHLLLAASAHLSIYLKDEETARKQFDQIPRISSMDARSRAALWGFRASFYAEYGIYGSKAGVLFATKAVQMDPQESLWYFVKGKLFGRVRRVEKPFDIPSPDELDALETALEKEANAAYAIFTAQVYRETANRAFTKHRNNGQLYPNLKLIIDQMNAKSYALYEKSLSLKPYCSHIKFRCAKGFMALPPPFKNTDQAKKCILDGLKMTPTSAYGNHVAAMFYERYEKDVHSALRHLKNCVALRVFGACFDLLRLEWRHSALSKADALLRLEQLHQEFAETARRCQILSQLVSYFLFVDYVLERAIDYLMRVFRLNSSCDDIHNHRSLFVNVRKPFSLLDVVVDETKIRLADQNCGEETRAACNRLLSELVELNVGYARNRPRHLRQQLLKQTFAPARAGGVLATAGRASRNRAARPSTSSSNTTAATVSRWRRREQRAATDGTLRRIDELTNAWKTESRRRTSVEDEDEDDTTTTCRTEGRRVDEAELSRNSSSDDDDPAADSCVGRLGRVRYAAGRPPPGDSQRPAPRSPPTLDALTISAGDSDFEKSVHAYRLAKRAARPLASSDDAIGPATVSANRSGAAGSDGASRRGRPKSNGKTFGDDAFNNYLARSTAGLARKFRPGQIEF